MTASFRVLYERLIFQSLIYNCEQPCCNESPIPVLLIMTSNAPDTYFASLMRDYQQIFNQSHGPTQTFVRDNTLHMTRWIGRDRA